MYWQNKFAISDSVKKEMEGINSKLTSQVNEIKSNNIHLDSLINKKNEKIIQNTIIIGQLISQMKNLETQKDTIYDENQNKLISIRRFNIEKLPFYISGNFQIEEPFYINIDTLYAKIKLTVTLTENKNKNFKTYISSPYKNLLINEVNSQIIPYNQSFWNKVKLGIGTLIAPNYASLYIQTGYNNITILTGYGTTGISAGISYWFK
jgi:hypothetical protein